MIGVSFTANVDVVFHVVSTVLALIKRLALPCYRIVLMIQAWRHGRDDMYKENELRARSKQKATCVCPRSHWCRGYGTPPCSPWFLLSNLNTFNLLGLVKSLAK